MSYMDTPITKLYGVGKVRAEQYARLGISTVGDILSHYPRGYEDRGNVILLSEADGRGKSSHILTVGTEPRSVRLKGRMTLLKFRAYDESGVCDITFFNQDFLKSVFVMGESYRFYGKLERIGGRYSMSSPAYEVWSEDRELPCLIPVYPLTEGLSTKQITKDINSAFSLVNSLGESGDFIPEDIRLKNKLCTRTYALKNIHFPDSFASLAAAKKRLIFEELFVFGLGMAMSSARSVPAAAYPCSDRDVYPLVSSLPFELTEAQKKVIGEISKDMSRDTAMNRMVIGDVGCGKTVVAAAAMYLAVKNGRQAALMAPTEILARQHYEDLRGIFEPLGIKVELLVGATAKSEKNRIYASLATDVAEDGTDIVIGTHALLNEGVRFARPGIVVADEQHRFGVNQRALLAEKNMLSHTLVMSATPIPRTLALALYGDLELSVIDMMPVGRQRVDTFCVDEGYRARLNAFIDKNIKEGGQVYVVCPAVEEQKDEEADLSMEDIDGEGEVRRTPPLRSAVKFSEELAGIFSDYRVAFVHGKMKPSEKNQVMQDFCEGRIQILVSTTVIEVGVNVPNATLMIVENAERFGLSQLHQLRGRVGRGSRKSYCILVSEASPESKAGERLKIMKTLYNGFSIAEHDLAMRGPGDFLRGQGEESVRQSGGVKFRLAGFCDDAELMDAAFSEAKAMVENDNGLSEHPELRDTVERLFTLERGTVN